MVWPVGTLATDSILVRSISLGEGPGIGSTIGTLGTGTSWKTNFKGICNLFE